MTPTIILFVLLDIILAVMVIMDMILYRKTKEEIKLLNEYKVDIKNYSYETEVQKKQIEDEIIKLLNVIENNRTETKKSTKKTTKS